MGLFKGIEDAKMSEGGTYLKPGIYDIQILRVKTGQTRKKIDFFVVDFKILGSNNPEHAIGSTANWWLGFDKDGTLGNIKQWAVAVLSNTLPAGQTFDAAQITEPVLEGIIANEGAIVKDQKLKVQVTLVDTQNGGKFSRHHWYPASVPVAA